MKKLNECPYPGGACWLCHFGRAAACPEYIARRSVHDSFCLMLPQVPGSISIMGIG